LIRSSAAAERTAPLLHTWWWFVILGRDQEVRSPNGGAGVRAVLAVTFGDLIFRIRQFLIAIIGVTLVLALALLLSGLASGFGSEVSQTIGGFGASTWILSKGAGGRITAFAAFPEGTARHIAAEPMSHDVSPVLLILSQVAHVGTKELTVNLVGVDPGKLGNPSVVAGRAL
jgi:hypothetical protein